MSVKEEPVMKNVWLLALALVLPPAILAHAQGRGAAPAAPPPSARSVAPQDLTGYWVAVVTEHWHLRMLVPPKGDFSMLRLTPEAIKVANTWDPVKEAADADQCKSYGAAAIMRVPGRLNIQWEGDNTLRVDTDSGMQTRLF